MITSPTIWPDASSRCISWSGRNNKILVSLVLKKINFFFKILLVWINMYVSNFVCWNMLLLVILCLLKIEYFNSFLRYLHNVIVFPFCLTKMLVLHRYPNPYTGLLNKTQYKFYYSVWSKEFFIGLKISFIN